MALLALASCAAGTGSGDGDPTDFNPVDWTGGKSDSSGLPATFDRNNITTDVVMTTIAVDANGVQQFLENSPYGYSWLADLEVDGVMFSEQLVAVSSAYGIDPVVLLARMQVESSLVSPSYPPSQHRIDRAMGCACPDGSTCGALGLMNQLDCAGQVLSDKLAEAQAGTGVWNVGETRSSSDHYAVTPDDAATAALYAYTPWVLPGRGGNWLVWNVTRRYLKAFDAAGLLNLPAGP